MLSLSRTAHIGQVYTYGSYCLYEMYQKKVRESKFLGVVGRDELLIGFKLRWASVWPGIHEAGHPQGMPNRHQPKKGLDKTSDS